MTASNLLLAPQARSIKLARATGLLNGMIYLGAVLNCLSSLMHPMVYSIGDNAAYFDISEVVHRQQWPALVNSYWFPLYPVVLAAFRALFGFRVQYDWLAANLASAVLAMLLILSSMALAAATRRLMRRNGLAADRLLPVRILYPWVAAFACFFACRDLAFVTPDALLSSLILLAVAAQMWGVADSNRGAFFLAGICWGLAFLTKSFAFPAFLLCLVLTLALNWRTRRKLSRMIFTMVAFAAIAGPYIGLISMAKGRFTLGDTGGLDAAWFVNNADVYNPVSDPSLYHVGNARVHLRHPAEVLVSVPEAVYFGSAVTWGSAPQWDEPSYWSDGLSPRLSVRQSLRRLRESLAKLARMPVMRFQALLLVAGLCYGGFRMRRTAATAAMVWMPLLLAFGCIGAYSIVLMEERYIAFALVMAGVVFAGAATVKDPAADRRALHGWVFLLAALILTAGLQESLREAKAGAETVDAQPLSGIFNRPLQSSAADFSARYPRGSEVACMGYDLCLDKAYWAHYAGVRFTGVIETGSGSETAQGLDIKPASVGCALFEKNPDAFDRLREKRLRAVVAYFGRHSPCSSSWLPLGEDSGYYYRPL